MTDAAVGGTAPNQWLAFRRDVTVDRLPRRAVAVIAADSKYWLWVNGRSSECRPCLHEVCRVVTDEDEVNHAWSGGALAVLPAMMFGIVPAEAAWRRFTVKPDSIVSPVSNPWMRPDEINMYYAQGDSVMKNIRTVSVPWCAYSTVIQLRSWLPDEVGGVAWVSLDNPGESPRFPIFAGNTELPKLLQVCGQHVDRDDAALWHYRKTNRLATVRWGTYRKTLEPQRDYFIKKGQRELPYVEQTWQALQQESPDEARTMLNGYTADFFGATILRWDEMARTFWRQTWTGF